MEFLHKLNVSFLNSQCSLCSLHEMKKLNNIEIAFGWEKRTSVKNEMIKSSNSISSSFYFKIHLNCLSWFFPFTPLFKMLSNFSVLRSILIAYSDKILKNPIIKVRRSRSNFVPLDNNSKKYFFKTLFLLTLNLNPFETIFSQHKFPSVYILRLFPQKRLVKVLVKLTTFNKKWNQPSKIQKNTKDVKLYISHRRWIHFEARDGIILRDVERKRN